MIRVTRRYSTVVAICFEDDVAISSLRVTKKTTTEAKTLANELKSFMKIGHGFVSIRNYMEFGKF